jgi:anion-transporting  ArsA/GET3 family ATPase
VGEFAQFGLEIQNVVVNHVITDPDSEFLHRRQAMQRPYLELLDQTYGQRMTITRLPLLAEEIKGVDRLQALERLLFNHSTG